MASVTQAIFNAMNSEQRESLDGLEQAIDHALYMRVYTASNVIVSNVFLQWPTLVVKDVSMEETTKKTSSASSASRPLSDITE